jgi:hypothetical protein
MVAIFIMDSGVLISPVALKSNKQYARFFIPTSMLSTLNADPTQTSSFIADCITYIPSHEAIAGDGIVLFCGFFFTLICVHAFMCLCALQREK